MIEREMNFLLFGTHLLLIVISLNLVLASYSKQQRDASIKEDLTKLYDTRPTSDSLSKDAYVKAMGLGKNSFTSGFLMQAVHQFFLFHTFP